MINKQAIEFFKGQKEIFKKDRLMYEAINIAIKALEQKNATYTGYEYDAGYENGYEAGYKDGYTDGKNITCSDLLNMIEEYKYKNEK